MKRIAMSVFTIFAMVAVVASGTVAVFSQEVTISGNTVSTANLDITVSGDPLSQLNLVPGEIFNGWAVYNLSNNSTAPVKVSMYLDVADSTQCEMLEFYQIWAGIGSDNTAAKNDRTDQVPHRTPINDLNGPSNSVQFKSLDGTEVLQPGDKLHVQMRASMSGAADNSYQNLNCQFATNFVGETL